MSIHCQKITKENREGPYEGIILERDGSKVLELRLTQQAVLVGNFGQKNQDIYQWLYEVGMSIIDEIKEPKVMIIYDADIMNGEIVGSWKERELYK